MSAINAGDDSLAKDGDKDFSHIEMEEADLDMEDESDTMHNPMSAHPDQ